MDIQGLESVRLPEEVAASLLNDARPELNNYFVSFKEDPTHKRLPEQSGCAPGAIVRIPESTHDQYYTIVAATPTELKLKPSSPSDGEMLIVRRIGPNQLQLVAENVAVPWMNEACTPNRGKAILTYTMVVTWGASGSVSEIAPSAHFLDMLARESGRSAPGTGTCLFTSGLSNQADKRSFSSDEESRSGLQSKPSYSTSSGSVGG